MRDKLDMYDSTWCLREKEVYGLLEEYASLRIEEYKREELSKSVENNKLVI